jgi:hypothetical protein
VLTGTSTGSGWKVIYKDGSTDITSYVEGNGYPLTLSSAEKRTISIILMPLDSNSGTLQISLSAYTNGYPLNIVTRSISAQGGVEPSQKFTTSSVGYNQETGKMNVYFVASSDQLGGASISATQETLAKLFIYNLSGKLVYQQDVPVSAGYNLVEVQATLGRGTYIYQLVYNGKVIYSGTFVNKS